ncbi:hypothetical protein [Streptomyces antarcticus]|uniref:hypothetical protein n=1 Tax=Streptomyces antarcticus TaxID=2996458 RepID=UPI00226E3D35|nr:MULTISPECIES: hypothetical protein [unclassified Streptomyces]MCY0944922.1 hypothetical protein [Streptomyces sp. H34-AA3]MCZ4088354.1 hypothetical protein [Streptomyces sp. H34-S5]
MSINRSISEQGAPTPSLMGAPTGTGPLRALIGRLTAVPGGQGATAGFGPGWSRRGHLAAVGASAPASIAAGCLGRLDTPGGREATASRGAIRRAVPGPPAAPPRGAVRAREGDPTIACGACGPPEAAVPSAG